MLGKILIPSDLSHVSNSVFPYAVTLAQVFGSKLYLVHVMDPASVNEPERLEDFPRLSKFFSAERDAPDLPHLKHSVPIAKIYRYSKSVPEVILDFAKSKQVDLICMASNNNGTGLAWWSAGRHIDRVIKNAPCSVLCMRGRSIKEKDWKRPRFKHILLLVELGPNGVTSLVKVLPWVQKFNSMLHIFPLLNSQQIALASDSSLREVSKLNSAYTNVLLFADPDKRMRNLMNFVGKTPIDLIVMTPRTRAQLSTPLISDIVAQLLKVTESPILLLR
jgi:nucleotide-binding universal stress UspA family protein